MLLPMPLTRVRRSGVLFLNGCLLIRLFFPTAAVVGQTRPPSESGQSQVSPKTKTPQAGQSSEPNDKERAPDATDVGNEDDLDSDAPEATPPPPPDGILPVEELSQIEFPPSARMIPSFVGERLILVGRDGAVSAYDPGTAEFMWKLGVSNGELFPPIAVDGGTRMWIASRAGELFEVGVAEGDLRTEIRTELELAVPPLGVLETVYLASKSRKLVALSAVDGSKLWEVETPEPVAALSGNGAVLAVSGGERTLSLHDARTGSRIWDFATLRGFRAPAVFDADGKYLYIGDEVGDFYCLKLENGKRRYRWSTGAAIRTAPLVEGNRVYVATYGNILFAFKAGNGQEQWRAHLAGRPAMAPKRVFQRLIIATLDGGVEEIQPATGRITAQYRLPGELTPFPAMYFEPVALDSELVVAASLASDIAFQGIGPSLDSDGLFGLLEASPAPETEDAGGIDEDSELGRALAALDRESDPGSGTNAPLWFEKSRIALTLRSGQVVVLKHQRPVPPAPEMDPVDGDGELPVDEDGTDAPSAKPTRDAPKRPPRRPPSTHP